MKFILDENLPFPLVDALQALGHQASHVRNIGLKGAPDKDIVKHAKTQKAVLITKDVELGSLLLYPRGSHHGLIVLRLPSSFNKEQITKALITFLTVAKEKDVINTITVIEAEKYRVRKLGNGSSP